MPITNIDDILKHGASTKVHPVNYESENKQKELKELKARSENILKSKDVNWSRLSSFVIKK